jgi:hypothetical protein
MALEDPAVGAQGSMASPSASAGRPAGLGPLLGFLALVGVLAWFAASRVGAAYAPAMLVPAGIAGLLAVILRPGAGVVALLTLTGFQGTLLAYTVIPGRAVIDFILVGLWLGLAWMLINERSRPTWLLPGLVVLGIYGVVSIVGAFFASPVSDGIKSVHLSIWLMGSLFLVGLAPWSTETIWRIVKGTLVVGALVAAYAILRTITGPTEAERELALTGKPGFLQLKTSGSLPSAGHLASWCTAMLPFALALAFALRGRWQYLAAATAAGSLFAVLATEVRIGIVAAIAAVALVFVATAAAKAFSSGTRAVRLAVTGMLAVMVAIGAYATTIGTSDESSARFERILNPTEDFAYSTRLTRWEEAFEIMGDKPFGQGLGTLGSVAATSPLDPELTRQLDSSYIKVGVEQGPWVLLLLMLGLLLLLANLFWRSIHTLDRGKAAIGIGATGALLGLIISLYANTFIEEPQILAGWLLAGLGVAQFSHPRTPTPSAIDAELAG